MKPSIHFTPTLNSRSKQALALSALLGTITVGSVLTGAPAQAGSGSFSDTGIFTPISGMTPVGMDYQSDVGDKRFTITNTPVVFSSGNTQSGDISFHSPTPGVYTAFLNFRNFTTNAALQGASTGTFTYEMEITNPDTSVTFKDGWLSSVVEWPGVTPPGIQVTKTIDYLDIGAADTIIGPSVNGAATPMTALAASRKIRVTDSWLLDANGAPGGSTPVLRSFTNSYTQTPGPLGVLGAGAAFGFSRKLRGRIRQARQA